MDQRICDECRVDLSWKVRVTNWTNANGPNGEYCVPCAVKNGLLTKESDAIERARFALDHSPFESDY
jgi:hypothetical protein